MSAQFQLLSHCLGAPYLEVAYLTSVHFLSKSRFSRRQIAPGLVRQKE